MKRNSSLSLFILFILLSSCKPGIETPEAIGSASPEAVAKSLSTIDPEDSIHLFAYDQDAPLDIQEEKRWHEGNATWIDFTYSSPKGGRVPARLVIPDGKGPFPGIILQHGGPGTLEDVVDFARTFAKYGAVTIMITSPYRRPGGWEITQYMGNTWPIFTERDLEIKIQMINDLQRSVDILLERSEVDPERLAFFGLSWGGTMGGLLAGVENRILAYVLVVGDGGLVEHTADPGDDGINIHFSENWAAQMWPTEPFHFVGRAAPAALLFQNGIHDEFVPPHDALRYFIAASEPKTILWYDAGHNLPWGFVHDAAEWLQQYLGDQLLLLGPNYRPTAVLWDRGLFAFAAIMVVIFLWDSFESKAFGWNKRILWLIGVLYLGPIGLILYWITEKYFDESNRPDLLHWRHILAITVFSTIILMTGVFVGDKINEIFPIEDFRLRFLQLYVTTNIISGSLVFLTRRTNKVSYFAFSLTLNSFWVIVMLYPSLMQLLINLSYWTIYPIETLLGIIITFPLHFWFVNQGLECWNCSQDEGTAPARFRKPPTLVIVGLVALSYLVALGSVFMVVKLYTGFPWKDVILIMRGVYL